MANKLKGAGIPASLSKMREQNKKNQDKRKAELATRAKQLGWDKWITMITDIKNGKADAVRVTK